jgi:quercetin dioxygenase-like cupin family protein
MSDGPTARVLGDVHALTAPDAVAAGVLWKLGEPGRQLDANLVHLPADRRVETHAETDLDVLLLVVAGAGTMGTPDGPQDLAPGALVWLPHGSTRSLGAGPDGLSYVTVHRRRPGMRIGPRPA